MSESQASQGQAERMGLSGWAGKHQEACSERRVRAAQPEGEDSGRSSHCPQRAKVHHSLQICLKKEGTRTGFLGGAELQGWHGAPRSER